MTTKQELRQHRKINAKQARTLYDSDTDLRVTSEGEVWFTRDGKRCLINRSGQIIINGGKISVENWRNP